MRKIKINYFKEIRRIKMSLAKLNYKRTINQNYPTKCKSSNKKKNKIINLKWKEK